MADVREVWKLVVADVKKNIETVQGTDVYPAAQQMLIHQGKVLKDGTTLEEYKVAENSFITIMLSKSKSSAGEASTAAAAPKAPQTSTAPAPMPPTPGVVNRGFGIEALERLLRISPAAFTPPPANVTLPAYVPLSTPASVAPSENVYGDAASNLVAGNNPEGAVQQILDMGGCTWDRDTVVRSLRAAFNNRAVEYLYSGIPEAAAVPPVTGVPPVPAVNSPMQAPQATQPAAAPTSGPNANPLNLFPQGFPYMGGNAPAGTGAGLWFLRTNPQFQAFRAMVQANLELLQPMLQELGKQYPQLARLIQEHQADFLHLINEPVEGGDLKQWDLTER